VLVPQRRTRKTRGHLGAAASGDATAHRPDTWSFGRFELI
jgi:hypothetical protein